MRTHTYSVFPFCWLLKGKVRLWKYKFVNGTCLTKSLPLFSSFGIALRPIMEHKMTCSQESAFFTLLAYLIDMSKTFKTFSEKQ